MGKKAGKKAQSHDERAKTTSALSQPAATSASADSSSLLTRFSPSGRLFAQVSLAVDADTCRVYEVHSGQCVGRWASSSASERVSCVEWAELPSSSSSGLNTDEKTGRSKKRRKGSSTEGHDKQTGADGALEQDAGASASTSARADEASSPAAAFEVLALGLKNASILILHPTQSTVIQTLSHSSVTSSPVSLSFASSSASATRPSFLWSCTSSGQLSAWSLPSLAGSKGKLVAQYDTQCASCSEIAVRYVSPSKAQVNGMQNASTSAPLPTTAQILLGNFSIKLLEATLPSVTSGTSDGFERPRIHIKAEFSGHASEIIQLAWLNRAETEASQARFISIAKGDRFVSLWSALTTSHADTPVSGSLSATLGLDEEPRRIAVAADNQSICCISSDAARIISLEDAFSSSADQSSSQAPAGKQRRRNVRSLMAVSTITSPQATNPCTDAYFAYNIKNTIYVAAGVLKPSLERLAFRDDTGSYIAALQLSSRNKASLNGVNGHSGAEAPRAAYAEASQSAVLSAEASRDPSVSYSQATQAADPTAEPTIAERLKDLEVQDNQAEVKHKASTGRKSRRHGGGKYSIGDALSTTQSLVQALHSADVRLLETCLAEKNPKVIRATVRRVPGSLVLPLVEALVERLSRTRKGVGEGAGGVDASRGQVLIEWLRNVLSVHLGYLVTIPSLVERLSALHATLESRMSFHSQLLALNGRLDLVVSQIEIRAHPIQDSQKIVASTRNVKTNSAPMARYVEGEESESESSDEEEEEEGQGDLLAIDAAEEGADEDIEDLVMANGDVSLGDIDDDDEEDDEEDEDEEDDIPALRKSKSTEKPKLNGFLDIEAEESENEGSDEDGMPPRSRSSGVKLNGVINEDSLDEDEEDLDRYESDFINDDTEEEEESDNAEGDDDDEE